MLIRPIPISEDDVRDRLMDLRKQYRETWADLSELIGEGEGYLAAYVRRSEPAELPERHKRTLARYFNVEAEELGVVPAEQPRPAYVKPPLRERAQATDGL